MPLQNLSPINRLSEKYVIQCSARIAERGKKFLVFVRSARRGQRHENTVDPTAWVYLITQGTKDVKTGAGPRNTADHS